MSRLINLPSGSVIDLDRVALIIKSGIREYQLALIGVPPMDIPADDAEHIKSLAEPCPEIERQVRTRGIVTP